MKVPDPYIIMALDAGRRVQRYTPESAEAFFESERIQDAGYGDIDLDIVWRIASQHLSGVMQELETLQASSLPDL